jgi:putative FmdB family regulatory protein
MPTYEYVCRECETSLTDIRSIHADDPTFLCEKCGYVMTQVVGNLGIQFKGSGFYRTDK